MLDSERVRNPPEPTVSRVGYSQPGRRRIPAVPTQVDWPSILQEVKIVLFPAACLRARLCIHDRLQSRVREEAAENATTFNYFTPSDRRGAGGRAAAELRSDFASGTRRSIAGSKYFRDGWNIMKGQKTMKSYLEQAIRRRQFLAGTAGVLAVLVLARLAARSSPSKRQH